MKDSIVAIDCPCCGARLEVDVDAGKVLSHSPGKPRKRLASLDEGLKDLERQEADREAAFQKSFQQNLRESEDLDRKFAGLLKKQKGKKIGRQLRELDLD